MSGDFYVTVGQSVILSRTVTERDVDLFAEVTGDFAPVHMDEATMKKSVYGQRIAHGALLVGYMSALSTRLVAEARESQSAGETPVALGYDRIRFLAPVFFGDTVTLTYTITDVDTERRRSLARIEAKNQRGDVVAVATGLLKWVRQT